MQATYITQENGAGWAVKYLMLGTIITISVLLISHVFRPIGPLMIAGNVVLIISSAFTYKKNATEAASHALIAIGMLKIFPFLVFVTGIPYFMYEVPYFAIGALLVLIAIYTVSIKVGTGKLSAKWLYALYVGVLATILLTSFIMV